MYNLSLPLKDILVINELLTNEYPEIKENIMKQIFSHNYLSDLIKIESSKSLKVK